MKEMSTNWQKNANCEVTHEEEGSQNRCTVRLLIRNPFNNHETTYLTSRKQCVHVRRELGVGENAVKEERGGKK